MSRVLTAMCRIIVQAFIQDVKNAMLFGTESVMSFRDMANLRIPTDLDAAWYAQSVEEWEAAWSARELDDVAETFSTLLKELWRPSRSRASVNTSPSGSIALLYGIVSVAREVARREDSVLAGRTKHGISSLSITIDQSLVNWENAWMKTNSNADLPWMVPTCDCLLQLARSTLFAISPVDLQIVAGKDVVEGRRKGRADYSAALRNVRIWAKVRGVVGAKRE
jgi:hypothetical protein